MFKRLLYSLAFFHGVVSQRKFFGSVGKLYRKAHFIKPYRSAFINPISDFHICSSIRKMDCKSSFLPNVWGIGIDKLQYKLLTFDRKKIVYVFMIASRNSFTRNPRRGNVGIQSSRQGRRFLIWLISSLNPRKFEFDICTIFTLPKVYSAIVMNSIITWLAAG